MLGFNGAYAWVRARLDLDSDLGIPFQSLTQRLCLRLSSDPFPAHGPKPHICIGGASRHYTVAGPRGRLCTPQSGPSAPLRRTRKPSRQCASQPMAAASWPRSFTSRRGQQTWLQQRRVPSGRLMGHSSGARSRTRRQGARSPRPSPQSHQVVNSCGTTPPPAC